jgi:hypothetical protein
MIDPLYRVYADQLETEIKNIPEPVSKVISIVATVLNSNRLKLSPDCPMRKTQKKNLLGKSAKLLLDDSESNQNELKSYDVDFGIESTACLVCGVKLCELISSPIEGCKILKKYSSQEPAIGNIFDCKI